MMTITTRAFAPPLAPAANPVAVTLSPGLERVLRIVARRTLDALWSGPESDLTISAISADVFGGARSAAQQKAGVVGGRVSATARHLERLRALGLVYVWRSAIANETVAVTTTAGHDWVRQHALPTEGFAILQATQ